MIVERFPFPSPFLRFPTKPSRPGIVASTASSHPKSHPPFSLPRFLLQVGRLLLSWDFQPLRLLPPLTLPQGRLHLMDPFSPLSYIHLTMNLPRSLKVFLCQRLGSLLPKKAPACLAFLTSVPSALPVRNVQKSFGLFFHLGIPVPPHDDRASSLFEALPASPNGG
jgi:hypothetical protein